MNLCHCFLACITNRKPLHINIFAFLYNIVHLSMYIMWIALVLLSKCNYQKIVPNMSYIGRLMSACEFPLLRQTVLETKITFQRKVN